MTHSELNSIWTTYTPPQHSNIKIQFALLQGYQEALEKVFQIIEQRSQLPDFLNDLDCFDISEISKWNIGCQYYLLSNEQQSLQQKKDAFLKKSFKTSDDRLHPIAKKLHSSIKEMNLSQFYKSIEQLETLNKETLVFQKEQTKIKEYKKVVPKLIEDIRNSYQDNIWKKRISTLEDAFAWSKTRSWLFEQTDVELSTLSQRIRQIDEDIARTMEELVQHKTWYNLLKNQTEESLQHMKLWQNAIRRLGKGTGKHAWRHRKNAKKHLEKSLNSVPAWILPINKIWSTVSPQPEMFDVLIIDEASQCGLEDIPLLYLAKKIVVVGDDKQTSPSSIGVKEDDIAALQHRYLKNWDKSDLFDMQTSLFDMQNIFFGKNSITLREHFRCMPEIIEFSNRLCYQSTPLIPLRQFGSDRLEPIKRVYVENGLREGSSYGTICNPQEAKQLVNRIAELCKDPKYKGKTMGIIVLQGGSQAKIIESLLLERISIEDIEERKIICGDAYHFQGDERDIIFLSLVAAPNVRIGALTKLQYEKSFNVAMSRAKDQVWLFHSVKPEELSPFGMRRKLLDYFINPPDLSVEGHNLTEIQKKAHTCDRQIIKPDHPFDSWFEVDVALEIWKKGYVFQPQYPVVNRRIDLVIFGEATKLAVECDGDFWHGPDQFEQDMLRQAQLERCGWEFFRVRGSNFYANKEKSLAPLWELLENRGIYPRA